jgi:hypothetical protein
LGCDGQVDGKWESLVKGRISPGVTLKVPVAGWLNVVYQEQSNSESLSVEMVAADPEQMALDPRDISRMRPSSPSMASTRALRRASITQVH